MNTPSDGVPPQISKEVEHRLLHFEQTWGQPNAPSIEQLLNEVPATERANLFRELLFVEFEFLQRKKTEPLIEQYLSRFPKYEKIVLETAQNVGQYAIFKQRNIAGYTLLNELGRGGMGTVYKAKSDLLNNLVAFKLVNRQVIDNPESLKRFTRELDMIGRLKHPNIVEAKHAGVTEDGTPYLVMEFVEGITLAQWGKQNPPSGTGVVQETESTPPTQFFATDTAEQKTTKIKGQRTKSQLEASRIAKACDIIYAAALGLQAIHEAGLVHRDIKPGNIMLLPDDHVKILDLGLAKLREHIAEHPSEYCTQTQKGQFLGTPGYAAPEQMHSAADVDIRADIYSLGCTFFYLLYGRTPSERQMDEMPITFPKRIHAILDKMLAADPASRFQEPRKVAEALDSFLGRKKKVHWGHALVATALSFAVFFGIFFGVLSSRSLNHADPPPTPINTPAEIVDTDKPSSTNVELDTIVKSKKAQELWDALQEAVGFRYRGNTEEAEERLRKLETELRENPFEGSDSILAEVLSARGDCYFFEGFASHSLTERTVQRMTDCYNEAWKLTENSPEKSSDDFRMKLLCKLAVVKNDTDAIPLFETRPSLYHLFAERVMADDKQFLRGFVELFELSLDEDLTTREALDLRLFALERLISWAKENGCENLPRDLRALDRILLAPYPDADSSMYLHRLFDWAIRAKDPTDYGQLVKYLFRMRQGAERLSFPPGSALVLFYFSPWSDENGFAVYYPTDGRETQRFELPFNRTAIKEAIRKGEKLELCEPLVTLVRRDIELGVPIILSWDDTACWARLIHALSIDDWCFDKSLTIGEIMGHWK